MVAEDPKLSALLYYNKAMVTMLAQIRQVPMPESEVPEFVEDSLMQLAVRPAMTVGQDQRAESLPDFLRGLPDIIPGASADSYFLDKTDRMVEVRACKVTFEVRKARIVSFIDCSSAQRLEKAQSDSKYKTLLISTVSHELRTPVNAILGAISLLSNCVPKEYEKLLEVARESCNMLTFHINDFTVPTPKT